MKNINIPHKIRIKHNVSYEVVFVDAFDDEECRGECWKEGKQIKILNGMSNTLTASTLIHEMIHALEFEFDLHIPHSLTYLLEKAILKVLKLNKWI